MKLSETFYILFKTLVYNSDKFGASWSSYNNFLRFIPAESRRRHATAPLILRLRLRFVPLVPTVALRAPSTGLDVTQNKRQENTKKQRGCLFLHETIDVSHLHWWTFISVFAVHFFLFIETFHTTALCAFGRLIGHRDQPTNSNCFVFYNESPKSVSPTSG